MKVGIIGTGQLSLLMAQVNQDLNIELIPFGPENCSHLSEFCQPVYTKHMTAKALKDFAETVDVITYDSESIAIDLLEALDCDEKIKPSLQALKVFQNRFYEKNYLTSQHLKTPRYMPLFEEDNLIAAAQYIGFPAMIKTIKNGYDGRGQQRVNNFDELKSAWQAMRGACLLEEFVEFDQEISLIAARDINRNIVFYPVSENYHRNGQLRLSLITGYHPLQGMAENMIRKIMHDLDYIGCMAMEFFVKDNQLIVNEVAPRVHNSGHWTLDGASSSQFLKHLKAITGKYVFKPSFTKPVAMVNCIGELPSPTLCRDSTNLRFYDYGKSAKPERKLGHINILGEELSDQEFYATVANLLEELGEYDLASIINERVRYVA